MQNYYLIVPFSTNANITISLNSPPFEFIKDSYAFSIRANGINSYSLKVGLFKSETEAENFFPKINMALHWVTLQHKIGFAFQNDISKVNLCENPIEVSDDSVFNKLGYKYVDGFYDGNNPVIVCNQKNIPCVIAPSARAGSGIRAEIMGATFKESLAFNCSENIQEERKLKLGLQLYSNYFFEQSHYAKFITLVNVLEALSPSEHENKISKHAQDTVDEAKECVKAI